MEKLAEKGKDENAERLPESKSTSFSEHCSSGERKEDRSGVVGQSADGGVSMRTILRSTEHRPQGDA